MCSGVEQYMFGFPAMCWEGVRKEFEVLYGVRRVCLTAANFCMVSTTCL